MHRGLPCVCCSTPGSTGPWAWFSRLSSCWACSNGSGGSATTSYIAFSTAAATRMHMHIKDVNPDEARIAETRRSCRTCWASMHNYLAGDELTLAGDEFTLADLSL